MNKLDEISRVIGAQEANLANLTRTFEQHCNDDDMRHRENIQAMNGIADQVRTLNDTLLPVVESVKFMRPIVDGYQASKWKAAGALSLASTMVVGVGWLLTSVAGKLLEWIVAHLRF